MSSACIRLCGQTNFTKLLIEPDFPCLADEIAEPRPDMNIKATAFTESKKFYYTCSTYCAYRNLVNIAFLRLFRYVRTDHTMTIRI